MFVKTRRTHIVQKASPTMRAVNEEITTKITKHRGEESYADFYVDFIIMLLLLLSKQAYFSCPKVNAR